jgi:hypothetical protein
VPTLVATPCPIVSSATPIQHPNSQHANVHNHSSQPPNDDASFLFSPHRGDTAASQPPTDATRDDDSSHGSETDDHNYTFFGSALAGGNDLQSDNHTLASAEAWCSSQPSCVGFTFAGRNMRDPGGEKVYFKTQLNFNSDARCSDTLRSLLC